MMESDAGSGDEMWLDAAASLGLAGVGAVPDDEADGAAAGGQSPFWLEGFSFAGSPDPRDARMLTGASDMVSDAASACAAAASARARLTSGQRN